MSEEASPSSRDNEVSALQKHACPACGAQAEWNPSKQKLVCPFCGTESPYSIDRDDRESRRARARCGTARLRRGGRRAKRSAPQRAVPELQGDHGLRLVARRPELRVLRLAGDRRLRRHQVADSPGRRAAVSRRSQSRARRHSPVVAQQVARAGPPREGGARRHRQESLHSVLDLRCAGALSVGCGGRLLLLRQRRRPRQPGPSRRSPGTARALGSRRPAWSIIRSTTSSCRGRRAST